VSADLHLNQAAPIDDATPQQLTPEQVVAVKAQVAELGNRIAVIDSQLAEAKAAGGREVEGAWLPYEALGQWRSRAMAAKRSMTRDIGQLRSLLTYHGEKRREQREQRREEWAANRKARYTVIDDAYAAMRLLADVFRAACDLVDDDSDEHFDELSALVELGRSYGLDRRTLPRPPGSGGL
jgi:hypothetical protein